MGKRGPPPIQINWDAFDKLVSYQCTQEEIADFFNIDRSTLENLCLRDRGVKLSAIWTKNKNFGRVRLRKAQLLNTEKGLPGWSNMAIYLDKKMFPDENPNVVEARLIAEASQNASRQNAQSSTLQGKRTFPEFCEKAGYPLPYDKQIEMMTFGMSLEVPRLILGSRGYGKTDYVTILGVAYDIYLNPEKSTNLIITKSKTRNTAIIEEISKALEANGVLLDKSNSNCIRVEGLQGKDHSVEVITIKSSMRGRHPFRVLMDDPVTDEDVSEAMRLLVKRRYDEVYKLCKNILIIGQPAHKHDLYANLRDLIHTLEVPYGTIPELDPDLEAMQLAGVDETSIQMSYHLKIPITGTTPFDKIKYMDSFPVGGTSIAFIDPSHEGGDYTAVSVIKAYMQGVAVEGRTWKMAWNHCLEQMVAFIISLGVKRVAFETNALGDQPVIMLREMLRPYGIGVVGFRSNTNKHSRIMAAGTFAHLIHLSKKSDRIFTDQVVQYEYKAKHDDAPDSLASGLIWLGLIKGKE